MSAAEGIRMRHTSIWFSVLAAAAPLLSGLVQVSCAMPSDSGVVVSCSGVINQTIPGQGGVPDQVVANMYFGGCNPLDPGMQVLERTRPNADPAAVAAACTSDCNARIAAYAASHGETGPLPTCQTILASPCPGLGADITTLPASQVSAFQAGGPADSRISLTGTATLTLNGQSTPVPVAGIVDVTFAPCGTFASCPTISRFDVLATATSTMPVNIGGNPVQFAQVQNQGLAVGQQNATQLLMPAGSIEAEVTYTVGGIPASFHVSNDQSIVSAGGPAQFLSSIDVTMGNGVVRLQLTGVVIGHRPGADVSPRNGSFECSSPDPTAVSLMSTSTDVDQDLQSIRFVLDGVVQPTDGDPSSPQYNTILPLGAHQFSVVATDSRGATSTASTTFAVADTRAPTITPPGPITLKSCSFPDIGQATASDICGGVVITNDSPGNFNIGINTVNWLAEDPSFNDGRATQQVTVQQVTAMSCCPVGYNVIVMTGPTINGTAGNDCIIGTSNNDTINGLGGDDYIIAGAGQDTITGGDGNDTIIAGDGDDVIDGGNGNDRIFGGVGQDRITAGTGNDFVIGGDGDDIISGGDGDDMIFGNQGQDVIHGDNNNDHIEGGPGDNRIYGDAGDDELIGWVTTDTIDGGAGTNALYGLDGSDRLTGGTGNDTIWGGRGTNMCVGGGGTDALVACGP